METKKTRLAYTALGTLVGVYMVGPVRKLPYLLLAGSLFILGYIAGMADILSYLQGVF